MSTSLLKLHLPIKMQTSLEIKSVTGIVFSKKRDEVLLIKRKDVPVWVLPGGGIEKDELAEEAVVRELFEETGLQVKVRKTIGLYLPINRLSKITLLYECESLGGDLSLSPETKDIRFFPITSLPKLLPPPYDLWIQDALLDPSAPLTKKLEGVTYFTLFKNLIAHPLLVFRFCLARLGIPLNW